MKKICEICNGSGQLSYFKGVSRFLLSWEECPECGGLGYTIDRDADNKKKKLGKKVDDNGRRKNQLPGQKEKVDKKKAPF